MVIAGYTIGTLISTYLTKNRSPLKDLFVGNITLNLIFVTFFIIFADLLHYTDLYFSFFGYAIITLTIIGVYFIVREFVTKKKSIINITLFLSAENIPVIFGFAMYIICFLFMIIIIYYHSIFTEYDSLYIFLPISKSIIMGNGLVHDFFTGSDMSMRYPPFTQAIEAWLLDSFGYSSMRFFPTYFLFLGSLAIYLFGRNILKDRFYSLLGPSFFFVTPAVMVISSRFSLQQDLSFISILGASFYFLSEIVRGKNGSRINLIMLIICLSLLPLCRELGLIFSIAIFFLIPVVKFTKGNFKLRLIFSTLIFLPLYTLSLYDLVQTGTTVTIILRLSTIVVANCIIIFVSSTIKNQVHFKSLIISAKYLIFFMVPLIFILSNIIMFSGPYPTIVFSPKFSHAIAEYRNIFEFQDRLLATFSEAIQHVPRIDILFTAVALGSALIFFKIYGVLKIIWEIRNNHQYALIIMLLVVYLALWSYLLDADYQKSAVRHLSYIIPVLLVALLVGLRNSGLQYKIFAFGLIVASTYYFLFDNLEISNSGNVFRGIWIDPGKNPLISADNVKLAALLFSIWLLIRLIPEKYVKTVNFQKYQAILFSVLLVSQATIFISTNVQLSPPSAADVKPPTGWESNVFEATEYLNVADKGNILSLRAPAIPYLTNRTDYDIYSPQAFATSIFPILASKDITALKHKFEDMDIRYVVLPNHRNDLGKFVDNMDDKFGLPSVLQSDSNFETINLTNFVIYKYHNDPAIGTNLLGPSYYWQPILDTTIDRNNGKMNITVNTQNNFKNYNRAVLETIFKLDPRPFVFNLNYSSNSITGQAAFFVEMRDSDGKILWGRELDNTSGKALSSAFIIPKSVVGKHISLIFYIITETPGQHILNVQKAKIFYP